MNINQRGTVRMLLTEKFGEPKNLDELAQFVMAGLNMHADTKVVGFAWEVRYSDKVSNSHSSPIGYPGNWSGRTEGVPTGYPGFSGRVWVRYDRRRDGFGSDPFRLTNTYPGTGGGGAYDGPWSAISSASYRSSLINKNPRTIPEPACYSWDYKIWLWDWPLIRQMVEQEQIIAIVANEGLVKPAHRFIWEDPDTKREDDQYLRMGISPLTHDKETHHEGNNH